MDISIIGMLVAAGAVLVAYRVGFSSGFAAGRDNGFDDGRKEGTREGSMRGYAVGFDRGKRSGEDGGGSSDASVPGRVVVGLLMATVCLVYWFTSANRQAIPDKTFPSGDVLPNVPSTDY